MKVGCWPFGDMDCSPGNVRNWGSGGHRELSAKPLDLPAHISKRCDETVKLRRAGGRGLETSLGDRFGGGSRETEHVAQCVLELPYRADVGGLDRAGAR